MKNLDKYVCQAYISMVSWCVSLPCLAIPFFISNPQVPEGSACESIQIIVIASHSKCSFRLSVIYVGEKNWYIVFGPKVNKHRTSYLLSTQTRAFALVQNIYDIETIHTIGDCFWKTRNILYPQNMVTSAFFFHPPEVNMVAGYFIWVGTHGIFEEMLITLALNRSFSCSSLATSQISVVVDMPL